MAYHLTIDPRRCFGSGACALAAPDWFESSAGQPSTPKVTTCTEADVLEWVAGCPSGALAAVEIDEGESPAPSKLG